MADIGRHKRHQADDLRCRALVEGREADQRLLSHPHLVDIVGLQPRLDLQVVRIRYHFHDGVAGFDDAANRMRCELMDNPRSRRTEFDPIEHIPGSDAALNEFAFLALYFAELLDDFGTKILIDPYGLKLG